MVIHNMFMFNGETRRFNTWQTEKVWAMRKGKIKCNTNINTLSTCVFSDHTCTAVCMHMCTVVYSTDSALVVCLCISAAVVWTSSWLRPSSSEADVSPAASSGLTVGNSLHVIVCAMNCWWRICLCARLNNGNIKYLVRIIIIHFLATIEIWLITWKFKNKQTSREIIVFCENEDFSAHTLRGEHYLSFKCITESVLYTRTATVFGKSAMLMWIWNVWNSGLSFSGGAWKFWSKLWIYVWQQKQRLVLMDESNCVCMCSLVVSIFTGNFKLPCKSSHLIHFPLTVNVTTELLFPCDRYSSVENSYTLPQSFSQAPRSINVEGKKNPGHVKIKHRNKTL